jgi:hypothetical protein
MQHLHTNEFVGKDFPTNYHCWPYQNRNGVGGYMRGVGESLLEKTINRLQVSSIMI